MDPLRRLRLEIDLEEEGPRVLALGAHLKTTVTMTRGALAYVSPHLGDLDTLLELLKNEYGVRGPDPDA